MMWWNDTMGYPAGWVGWLLMTVGMIVFWTLVIAAIGALFRTPRDETRARTCSTGGAVECDRGRGEPLLGIDPAAAARQESCNGSGRPSHPTPD